MGCDIHVCVEIKKKIRQLEGWYNEDRYKLNHYHDEKEDEAEDKWERVPIYRNRNYRLFSVLANVRNNSDNIPISEPRGVPNNMSIITRDAYQDWSCDAHSASYFTLAELKAYGNKAVKYTGMMHLDEAKKVDKGEMPDSWCLSTSDCSYVYREWEREEDILSCFIDPMTELLREEFYIWGDTSEKDDQIRIVFWFDN